MFIPIDKYRFDGPHGDIKKIKHEPGVFLIVYKLNNEYYLLDVDYSNEMGKDILKHKRKPCWDSYDKGEIMYSILRKEKYTDDDLKKIVDVVRNNFKDIPCK